MPKKDLFFTFLELPLVTMVFFCDFFSFLRMGEGSRAEVVLVDEYWVGRRRVRFFPVKELRERSGNSVVKEMPPGLFPWSGSMTVPARMAGGSVRRLLVVMMELGLRSCWIDGAWMVMRFPEPVAVRRWLFLKAPSE